jgi:hypothetical protein
LPAVVHAHAMPCLDLNCEDLNCEILNCEILMRGAATLRLRLCHRSSI